MLRRYQYRPLPRLPLGTVRLRTRRQPSRPPLAHLFLGFPQRHHCRLRSLVTCLLRSGRRLVGIFPRRFPALGLSSLLAGLAHALLRRSVFPPWPRH